jgi:methyl-accepting chemotaxis protein
MKRLTVKWLMLAIAVGLAAVLLVVSFVSYRTMGAIATSVTAEHHGIDAMLAGGEARFRVNKMQELFTDVAATGDRENLAAAQGALQQAADSLDKLAAAAPELQSKAAELGEHLQVLHAAGLRMTEAYLNQGREAGNAVMREPDSGFDAVAETLAADVAALVAEVDGRLDVAATALGARLDSGRTLLVGLGIGSVLLFLVAMLVLFRKVMRPLTVLQASLQDLAAGAGDLTMRLPADGRDEMAAVSRSFNQFAEKIGTVVKQVDDTVGQLSTATGAMSELIDGSRRGMVKLQDNTDQVATAINEMSATVQEVANNAARAAQAAHDADAQAHSGTEVVSETIGSINALAAEVQQAAEVIRRLEQDSASIGGVLDVIRGVAEQTNLLALNAAIEAARAGDQGRGFAVVADEVRTLAQRTQGSTRDIQQMIERLQGGAKEAVTVMEQGQARADASVTQAGRAEQALASIAQAVGVISDMNAQIATAAEEQSAVAEDINRNVTQISHVVHEVAEQSRHSVARSGDNGILLGELAKLMAQFKVRGQGELKLNQAKAAHLAWGARLRAFLDGGATLSEAQAVSHHDCDFGRWYYGDGQSLAGRVPAFQQIETPHAELHRTIREIIQHQHGGRRSEAEAAYERVPALSKQIVALIEAVEAAVGQAHA